MTTCIVTFAVTPTGTTIVVKKAEVTIAAEANGTYLLPLGAYTYSITKEGYTPITDKALTIAAGDETTGTKTVTETITIIG